MGFTAAAEAGTELFAGAEAGGAAATEAGLTGLDLGGSGAVAGMTGAEQLGAITGEGLVSGLDLGGSGAVAGMTSAEQVAGGGTSLPSLAGILAGAKNAAPIIGGLGQMAGGIGSILAGQKIGNMASGADPFSPYRSGYAAQLSELMRDPNTVTNTPGYQFNLAQGLQGQQAQQAAQGRLVSGGALLQGQQFGQQLAGQTYQQQLGTLASLSGANQSPAAGAGAMSGLLTGQTSGTLGGAQAFASGLGTATGTPVNPLYSLYSGYNQPSPTPMG